MFPFIGNSTYQRSARRQKRGIWAEVFQEQAKDADFEGVFIDGSLIGVYRHATDVPEKTVLMPAVDHAASWRRNALSWSMRWVIFSVQAEPLLEDIHAKRMVADKVDDSRVLIETIRGRVTQAVILCRLCGRCRDLERVSLDVDAIQAVTRGKSGSGGRI